MGDGRLLYDPRLASGAGLASQAISRVLAVSGAVTTALDLMPLFYVRQNEETSRILGPNVYQNGSIRTTPRNLTRQSIS